MNPVTKIMKYRCICAITKRLDVNIVIFVALWPGVLLMWESCCSWATFSQVTMVAPSQFSLAWLPSAVQCHFHLMLTWHHQMLPECPSTFVRGSHLWKLYLALCCGKRPNNLEIKRKAWNATLVLSLSALPRHFRHRKFPAQAIQTEVSRDLERRRSATRHCGDTLVNKP